MSNRSLPDTLVLEQLFRGQLLPDRADEILRRLDDGDAAGELAELVAVDALLDLLHSAEGVPVDPRVANLASRLSALRPSPTGDRGNTQPHVRESDAPAAQGVALLPAPSPTPPQLYPFLDPSQTPDEIGRLGPFRILQLLGAGGMGMVFLAEDPKLRRRVAIKVMKPDIAQDASACQRFLREAQSLATLEHAHIVPVYQVGEASRVPFLVMPLLQGETLAARLSREGKLPLSEALRIGREIAEGLAGAHERGLIHRDIKPGNIWLEAGLDRVKILDFGLARVANSDKNLTQDGAAVGTPAYMAPEQARGATVDQRCDVFSLGCVLYQMSTGEEPFKGANAHAIMRALEMEQPPPPGVLDPSIPSALSELTLQMIARDRNDRPPSARLIIGRLEAIERGFVETTAEQAPRASRSAQRALDGRPSASRRRLLLAVALAVVVGITALVVLWANIPRDAHEKSTDAHPTGPAATAPRPAPLEVTDIIVSYGPRKLTASLDVRLINRGDRSISVSRVILEVLDVDEHIVKDALATSAKYDLDISDLKQVKDWAEVAVSHVLAKGEADRFDITLTAKAMPLGAIRSWSLRPTLMTSEGKVEAPLVKVSLMSNRAWKE